MVIHDSGYGPKMSTLYEDVSYEMIYGNVCLMYKGYRYRIGISCFSTKHAALMRERAKTGWLRIRIMCTSGATTFIPADSCFSEL